MAHGQVSDLTISLDPWQSDSSRKAVLPPGDSPASGLQMCPAARVLEPMIGLLAQLAKAAKLAQTAEAAIGVASSKLSPAAPTAAGVGSEGDLPAAYQAMIEAGGPDLRQLLSAEDASGLIGKKVRRTALAVDGETLSCNYHCADSAGTVLGIHIPLGKSWEHFDSEIPKKETFTDLGDQAFRGGRQIYVKCGDTVFWIHTAGEVMVAPAVEAARLVLRRLQDDTPAGDS